MNIPALLSVRRFVLPVIIISLFLISTLAEKAEAISLSCLFDGPSISATNVPYGGFVTVRGRVTGGSGCFATECMIYKDGIYENDCRLRFNQFSAGEPTGGTYGPLYATTRFLVTGEGMDVSPVEYKTYSASYTVTVDPPLPPTTCSYSGPWTWAGAGGDCFDPGKNFNNTPIGSTVSFFNTDSRFTSTSYARFSCNAGGVWASAGESCVPVTPPPPPPPPSIVNGSCGSANYGALSTELISALPPSQLCSAGTWSGWGGTDSFYVGDSINGSGNHVYGSGDYRAGWYWRCDGSGGGSYAGCMGYTPAVCGTANGGTFASAPSDPPSFRTTLCQTGTPSGVTTNATTYTWSCNNAPAASISCSANRASSMTAQITALGPVAVHDGGFWSKLISFITGEDNVASASGPDAYINVGQKARINWSSTGLPDSCTVSGPGYFSSSPSGTQTLTGLPVGRHTYAIRCTKTGFPGAATDSVDVVVSAPMVGTPPTPGGGGGGEGGITANPQSCGTGQINVSWTPVTGATTYTLRDGSSIIAASTGATSFAHTGLSASSSHSYNLRAENSAGNSAYSSSVSATAPGACGGPVPPTLTFGASPTSITAGSPSTLMWEPVNATSCWASDGWTGSKASSGSNSFVVNPMVTTTYSLECWNSIGISSGRQSTTVNVGAAPVGPDLISSGLIVPLSVAVSTPLNFSATVRNVGTSGTGIGFRDNFSYSTASNSGPWTDLPTIAKGALASGGSSVDNDSYTPAASGTIWIQHCVDSTNVIAEGANETPNCTVANGGAGTTVTGGANALPNANAGIDRVITLPTNSVSASGASASDPDGFVTSTVWDKVSGPASTISGGSTLTPSFNNLNIAGTYVYRLTVTDNQGGTRTDNVSVFVNPIPQCADGIDNSDPEDILIDMADPGCSSAGDTDETDTSVPPIITINTKTNSTVVVNPGDTVTIGWDTNNGDETSCTLTTSTNPDNIGNTVIFLPGGGSPEQGTLVSGAIFVKTKFTVTCAGVTDTVTVEPISGPIET